MSAHPDPRVHVRVPAKVNLALGVGDVRPDGFHDLQTVFQAVGLFDDVVATPADDLSLSVRGEGADSLPTDSQNLAWRAAQLLADTHGIAAHVQLELDKAIPIAGGLAGGSADAAATLLACATLWGLDDSRAALTPLAAQLGSDVAFLLLGGTALGTGRGEILEPSPSTGELHWVLAVSDFGISTQEAYRELDRQRAAGEAPPAAGSPQPLLAALADGDLDRIAALLINDLQPAALALAPQLGEVLSAGLAGGALAGIVSGSGPTCAFFCADALTARAVATALERVGTVRAVPAAGHLPPATVLR